MPLIFKFESGTLGIPNQKFTARPGSLFFISQSKIHIVIKALLLHLHTTTNLKITLIFYTDFNIILIINI